MNRRPHIAQLWRATLRRGFADDADGELHFLKGNLFPHPADELLGHRVGRHRAIELEADGFLSEMRKGVGHFAIEREAQVGVDFFLKLEKAFLGTVPRAGLDHDEDRLARLAIECEGVEASRVFNAERTWLGRMLLAAGIAHNAKGWTSRGVLSK